MKRPPKATAFNLKVEFDRETDGRWIADIPALPGVMVYGRTRKQALAAVGAFALRVVAHRLEHRGNVPREKSPLSPSFARANSTPPAPLLRSQTALLRRFYTI